MHVSFYKKAKVDTTGTISYFICLLSRNSMQAVRFSDAGVINYNMSFWSIRTLSHEWGLVQDFKFIQCVSTPSFTAVFCFKFHRISLVIVKTEIFMVQCIKSLFSFFFFLAPCQIKFTRRFFPLINLHYCHCCFPFDGISGWQAVISFQSWQRPVAVVEPLFTNGDLLS